MGAKALELEEEAADLHGVGGQRLGRGDPPLVVLAHERHGAPRALDLEARDLVAIERHHDLVAGDGDVLRQRRPDVLRHQEDRRLTLPHGVDALLGGVHLAEQERAAGPLLVLAGVDGHAPGTVETVALERGRRIGDELLHLRAAELLEELVDGVGVGGQRDGTRDLPATVGRLQAERLLARDDLQARHLLAVEGEQCLVAEVGHRARGVAQHGVREDEDGGLVALARVHPHAGRALGAEGQTQLLAVLEGQRDLRGRLVEPELRQRLRGGGDLPIDLGGQDVGDDLLDRPAVTARLHGGDHLPGVALALELDGIVRPLQRDLRDVLGLRGEHPPLASRRLLTVGRPPHLVQVIERPEPDEKNREDDARLPPHGGPISPSAAGQA